MWTPNSTMMYVSSPITEKSAYIVSQDYNSVYSTDSAEESERERGRKNELGRLARKRFEAMLRALSGRRGELARCMAFSLEHAEAANEVRLVFYSNLNIVDSPNRLQISSSPRCWWTGHLSLAKSLASTSSVTSFTTPLLPCRWRGSSDKSSSLALVLCLITSPRSITPSRDVSPQRHSRNRSRLWLISGKTGLCSQLSLRGS